VGIIVAGNVCLLAGKMPWPAARLMGKTRPCKMPRSHRTSPTSSGWLWENLVRAKNAGLLTRINRTAPKASMGRP